MFPAQTLPRVRRGMSRRFFCCFCERALVLSETQAFPISSSRFYNCTFFGRAAPDRAGARPYQSQRHRLVKSSNPQGRGEERVGMRNAGTRPNKRKLVVASLL
jgi:hypothetical protein